MSMEIARIQAEIDRLEGVRQSLDEDPHRIRAINEEIARLIDRKRVLQAPFPKRNVV